MEVGFVNPDLVQYIVNYGLPLARAYQLVSRYGNRAAQVVERLRGDAQNPRSISTFERKLGPGNPRKRNAAGEIKPGDPVVKKLNFGGNSRMGLPGTYSGAARTLALRKRPSKFEYHGSTAIEEIYGDVTNYNCCYINFQHCVTNTVNKNIGMALMRHIAAKYWNVSYTNFGDAIYPLPPCPILDRPAGIQIRYKDTSTDVDSFAYIYFNTTNTPDIVQPFTTVEVFGDRVAALFDNFFAVGARVLADFTILYYSTATVSDVQAKEIVSLDDIVFKSYVLRHIVIQNATAAEDGSTNIDNIQCNPLNCRRYIGRGTVPCPNDDADQFTGLTRSGANGTGVNMPTVAPPSGWNQPPDPSFFSGLKSAQSFKLQPGQSMMFKTRWAFTGTINTLLPRLGNVANYLLARDYQKFTINQHSLFAFEKIIKGGDQVSINYHVDTFSGCRVVRYRKAVCRRWNLSSAQNGAVIPPPAALKFDPDVPVEASMLETTDGPFGVFPVGLDDSTLSTLQPVTSLAVAIP